MIIKEGEIFDHRYLLVKDLGSGGFSVVWLAEDTETNNMKVALKIFLPGIGLDTDGLKVFSSEYALVFNLNHQFLLKPMHYSKYNRMPYLVMQYMPNGSVAKLCGKMSEQELAKFLVQVGDAIHYLHEQEPPIIHLDIKPGNILIDGKGNYLLSDFGISTKIRKTLTKSMGRYHEGSGTTAYMAPERFSKKLEERLPIKANDIFSLGVTIFELLTDELPYGELGGMVANTGNEPAELPEHYSSGLRAMVAACLSREPWKRPPAELIVKAARAYLEKGVWEFEGATPRSEPTPEPGGISKAISAGEFVRFVDTYRAAATASQKDAFYDRLNKQYGIISREEFEQALKEELQKTRPFPHTPPPPSPFPEHPKRPWLPWVVAGGVLLLAIAISIILEIKTENKDEGYDEIFEAMESEAISSGTDYTETYAGLNIDMVWIEGGEFWMGCTPEGDSDCGGYEKPRHKVKLAGFWMGKTEVTNAQFCKFLNEKGNQSEGGVEWIDLSGSYDDEKCRIYKSGSTFYVESGYENYPVIYVSWYGAKAFAAWLSEKTGKDYRLPSEAQWEYACRSGGKEYKYAWGNGSPTKSNGGNIADESGKKMYTGWTIWNGYTDGYVYTSPVGSFGVNEVGLADMSGNVWEWCEDRWHGNYNGAPTDGSAWLSGSDDLRCVRGGSWFNNPQSVRCSGRHSGSPDVRNDVLGFRLLRMK